MTKQKRPTFRFLQRAERGQNQQAQNPLMLISSAAVVAEAPGA
jgi:hypothetical protein